MQQAELGVAANGRKRRAKLVAGVGGEPAQPRLARRAAGQRRLHVPEHAVERQPDLTSLGVGVGVGHARGQLDLAGLQRQPGDLGRGGRHPAQRAQRQPDPHRAEHAGQQQDPAEYRGLDQRHVPERVVHAGQRQAGHIGPVGIVDNGDLVGAVHRFEVLGVAPHRAVLGRRRRDGR
jgi:hypothetical protein